jgi:hypothetical protein
MSKSAEKKTFAIEFSVHVTQIGIAETKSVLVSLPVEAYSVNGAASQFERALMRLLEGK